MRFGSYDTRVNGVHSTETRITRVVSHYGAKLAQGILHQRRWGEQSVSIDKSVCDYFTGMVPDGLVSVRGTPYLTASGKPTRPGSNRRMSDEALLVHIRAIHAEVKGEYGWPKMWKELVARGYRVGKERVRRLMKKHGIRARCKRKFVVTTDSKHHLPIAPDLVQRNFSPTAPNQVWTGDITYSTPRQRSPPLWG